MCACVYDGTTVAHTPSSGTEQTRVQIDICACMCNGKINMCTSCLSLLLLLVHTDIIYMYRYMNNKHVMHVYFICRKIIICIHINIYISHQRAPQPKRMIWKRQCILCRLRTHILLNEHNITILHEEKKRSYTHSLTIYVYLQKSRTLHPFLVHIAPRASLLRGKRNEAMSK